MARQPKPVEHARTAWQYSGALPPPHNHAYPARDAAVDRYTSSLMLASELLAAWCHGPHAPDWTALHARSLEEGTELSHSELQALVHIAEQIHLAWPVIGPLAEGMCMLSAEMEARGPLRSVYRALFPGNKMKRVVAASGKPILSRREIEVLREASQDHSHEEIAHRLGITPRTVDTHFQNIYKKLGVQRPMQAVARAAALGYLDIETIPAPGDGPGWDAGTAGLLNAIRCAHNSMGESDASACRELALAGLLLLTMSAMHAGPSTSAPGGPAGHGGPEGAGRGVVCEVDPVGGEALTFGSDVLHCARAIVRAPSHSRKHGFTPGNLFVLDTGLEPQGLNTAAIVEFKPDGAPCGAFCGAQHIGSRLADATSLAFDADGRLLAASGALTNRVLAFTRGGTVAGMFADGRFGQICVDHRGTIYATQQSGLGCIVKILSPLGGLVGSIGGTRPDVYYHGLAISSKRRVYVNRIEQGCGLIDAYDASGRLLASFGVPGFTSGQLCVDDQDRLYVPCGRSGDIKVLAPDGAMLRRIDLRGKILPFAVTAGDRGRLWVSGRVPETRNQANGLKPNHLSAVENGKAVVEIRSPDRQ